MYEIKLMLIGIIEKILKVSGNTVGLNLSATCVVIKICTRSVSSIGDCKCRKAFSSARMNK